MATAMVTFGISQAIGAINNAVNKTRIMNAAKAGNYEKLSRLGTHNTNSNMVVLGKYEGGGPNCYTTIAEANKVTYFSLDYWDEVASIVGKENMWKINEAFLNQQIGKAFYASHSIANATNSFLREIEFLGKGILITQI